MRFLRSSYYEILQLTNKLYDMASQLLKHILTIMRNIGQKIGGGWVGGGTPVPNVLLLADVDIYALFVFKFIICKI